MCMCVGGGFFFFFCNASLKFTCPLPGGRRGFGGPFLFFVHIMPATNSDLETVKDAYYFREEESSCSKIQVSAQICTEGFKNCANISLGQDRAQIQTITLYFTFFIYFFGQPAG